jgi:hypothetical protein
MWRSDRRRTDAHAYDNADGDRAAVGYRSVDPSDGPRRAKAAALPADAFAGFGATRLKEDGSWPRASPRCAAVTSFQRSASATCSIASGRASRSWRSTT